MCHQAVTLLRLLFRRQASGFASSAYRRFFVPALRFVALAILAAISIRPADAVILYETGPTGSYDPTADTTAPTGALAGSGWQDEGNFGGELGTAIAPNYFITAAHIGGNVGDSFLFDNSSVIRRRLHMLIRGRIFASGK